MRDNHIKAFSSAEAYFCRRETEEKEKESVVFLLPIVPRTLSIFLILGYPAGASVAERDITENKGTPYSPRVSFEAEAGRNVRLFDHNVFFLNQR